MHSINFNSLLLLVLISTNTVFSLNDAKFLGERSSILNNGGVGIDSNQRVSRRESNEATDNHSKRRVRGFNHQCKLSLFHISKKNESTRTLFSFLGNERALLIFLFFIEMKIYLRFYFF